MLLLCYVLCAHQAHAVRDINAEIFFHLLSRIKNEKKTSSRCVCLCVFVAEPVFESCIHISLGVFVCVSVSVLSKNGLIFYEFL